MNKKVSKQHRILAIAPSTRGFGFAVLEGEATLVDWGIKAVEGDKNEESLKKVADLIEHYYPDILVLEDHDAKNSRRSERVRKLGRELITLALIRKVKVTLFTREQVRKAFFTKGPGTKYEVAKILANRFPGELGPILPPKRKLWTSEDSRMAIFEAAALAVAQRVKEVKKVKK